MDTPLELGLFVSFRIIFSANYPFDIFCFAFPLIAIEPCPKLEKIKPMIPSMIQHMKNIGWIEGGGVKGQ